MSNINGSLLHLGRSVCRSLLTLEHRLSGAKLLSAKGLDIEKLKWEVETRGGFEKVEARREWRQAFFFLSFI